jgi:hypothetical protein
MLTEIAGKNTTQDNAKTEWNSFLIFSSTYKLLMIAA